MSWNQTHHNGVRLAVCWWVFVGHCKFKGEGWWDVWADASSQIVSWVSWMLFWLWELCLVLNILLGGNLDNDQNAYASVLQKPGCSFARFFHVTFCLDSGSIFLSFSVAPSDTVASGWVWCNSDATFITLVLLPTDYTICKPSDSGLCHLATHAKNKMAPIFFSVPKHEKLHQNM